MALQKHKTPGAFRNDNGGEYVTKDLQGFFISKGIIHYFSPLSSPQSNGVAEYPNRTIGDSHRAMLERASTYGKKFWADDVLISIYEKNRQPPKAIEDQTRYQAS